MTDEKKDEYRNVCVELDRLSILMLDMMKEYVDLKVLIENYIKTGSLHLAKARYIMGNKSVSSLQLPSDDCTVFARTKVNRLDRKFGSTESLAFEIGRFSLNDNENGEHFRGCDSTKTKGNNKKNSKAKKKDGKEQGNSKDDSNDGNESTTDTKGSILSPDPLKWFGVLVPQNLKYAQTNFSSCLDHIVQCVNLQIEMDSLRTSFKKLMLDKKNLSSNNK